MATNELLTVQQASEYLNLTYKTMNKYADEIKHITVGKKTRLFKKSDLDKFRDANPLLFKHSAYSKGIHKK